MVSSVAARSRLDLVGAFQFVRRACRPRARVPRGSCCAIAPLLSMDEFTGSMRRGREEAHMREIEAARVAAGLLHEGTTGDIAALQVVPLHVLQSLEMAIFKEREATEQCRTVSEHLTRAWEEEHAGVAVDETTEDPLEKQRVEEQRMIERRNKELTDTMHGIQLVLGLDGL